jgi:hypothetical protein
VRTIRQRRDRNPKRSCTDGAHGLPSAGLGPAWLAVATAAVVSVLFGTIAADARWLAALGGYVVRHGSVPNFVPYASAPSHGWANVPVLGELVFHALDALAGDRGLLIAQVMAVTVAFALLALDMRRAGAPNSGAVLVLFVLIPATFTALPVVRAQLFSLALFPLLVLLVRQEARRPSRRVWLLPPLLALWSNLHGAVLVGLAVAAAYLLLDRVRREAWVALGALAASVMALFATPALWRTGSYYAGVLDNEAARRGVGLWAPLSSSGIDIAFVVCGLVLAAFALRSRPPLWELAALVGLAVLTARAARGGVWFAFLAAPPGALALGHGPGPRARVTVPAIALLVGFGVFGLVRGPHAGGAGSRLLERALAEAAGTPVLATDQLAEQVALAGGRIWIGNPIDAFRRRDQSLYLNWLQGRPAGDTALLRAPRVVLAKPGSAAQRRLARRGVLREVARDADAVLYVRRTPRSYPTRTRA